MNPQQENNLGLAIIDVVASDNINDVTTTMLDASLTPILEGSVLEEIPLVGVFFKLFKAGYAIRERLFVRKLGKFLLELNTVPLEEREKFIYEINNDPELKQKVGENLLLLIDRLDDVEKASVVGKLFQFFVRGMIDHDTYRRYAAVVDKAHLPDLKGLFKTTTHPHITDYELSQDQMDGLHLLGVTRLPTIITVNEESPEYSQLQLLTDDDVSKLLIPGAELTNLGEGMWRLLYINRVD